MVWIIEPASDSDLHAIRILLGAAGLSDHRVTTSQFFVARMRGQIIGCVGLDASGSNAILRSLAVDSTHRYRWLGRALVDAVRQRAHDDGCVRVIALTVDAAAFFTRLGFRSVPRESLDGQTLAHWQFTTGICDSAACLELPLARDPNVTAIH